MKVLIVEDDQHVVEYYGRILRVAFEVEGVGTAAEGLERLHAANGVAALILDLHLPNGKGIDLVRQFYQCRPDIPIVCVSGYPFRSSELIAAGAQDFLEKPFTSPNDLLETMTKAVARFEARKVLAPIKEVISSMSEKRSTS